MLYPAELRGRNPIVTCTTSLPALVADGKAGVR